MKNNEQIIGSLDSQSKVAPVDTAGDRRETAVSTGATRTALTPVSLPHPEVLEKADRRTYSLEYKRKILKEAELCTQTGELGALLRREGLYSSHLTTWRRQAENGINLALSSKKRGPVDKKQDQAIQKIRDLEKELQTVKSKLKQAELIIEAQKKIAEILQIGCTSLPGIIL